MSSFCTKCGRRRSGDDRFCTGCGTSFPVDQAAVQSPDLPAPAAGETRAENAWTFADAAPQASAQPETRWDTTTYNRDAGTQADPWNPQASAPAAPAAPPAYGYTPSQPAPEAPAPAAPPAYGYTPSQQAPSYGSAPTYGSAPSYGYPPSQPTQTSYGWSPQSSPSPASPPSAPYAPAPGPGRRGRGRGPVVIAVVVAVLVAGGGAFAAVTLLTGKHHNSGAQPPGTPTVRAPQSHSASAAPARSSTAASSPTSSPTASKSASPSVSPSPSGVAVASSVNNPAQAGVVGFLNSYFTAINNHDYTAYNNLLVPSLQANDSQSTFESGFGTTKDKAETLTSITDTGGGGEAATVKFTSNQSLADSASNSTCTHWTITLYLQPNGSGYLVGPAPAGYHAAFAAC